MPRCEMLISLGWMIKSKPPIKSMALNIKIPISVAVKFRIA
jgi:hypothetical protein